jgi:hypothetical protein
MLVNIKGTKPLGDGGAIDTDKLEQHLVVLLE